MLDRQSPKPLYAQLEDIVRQKIENEEWLPNHLIPSENEISKMYGVSRMTARGVITRLVHEGLLYRAQGKGTFVSVPKIVSKPLSQLGIREQLEQMGYQISTKLLNIDKGIPPARVSKELRLEKNTQVYVVERIRYIKEEPLSLHTSYIPVTFCANLEMKDMEGIQLCDILEKEYDLKIVKIVETLESSMATLEEAKMLSVKKGFPLLLLENIVYTTGELPFEYTKVLFRGDKIKLRLEYHKNINHCP
ncbi:GntR family transcriptional regulator [Petroclostridium sp. X23]|uniref:GntR family transcriptional regulator n=1 Tax=Petroclostridium sp. X23 TaxID=3045146 RepID=UPI0024AE00EF|nr:GntR family transcriptional regulator [Petroclostridium sp. X23]WHH59914.1 GntR family transcriptional regulator [Petroclostridium sp. X23]